MKSSYTAPGKPSSRLKDPAPGRRIPLWHNGSVHCNASALMLIHELGREDTAEWQAFVRAHPDSTCYHDIAWREVAERAYRLPTRYLVARERAGGPIRGALPLFQVKGMVRAHYSNGLFGAYASPLADSLETRNALLLRAKAHVERDRLPFLVVKTLERDGMEETYPGFQKRDAWVIATLELEQDPEKMWLKLRDKIRNCVRKAQRFGLQAQWGSHGLAQFYDVLAENMHQKGAPIYGYEFMRELVSSLGERAEVLTLWQEDKVVSSALVLKHGKTVTVPFASSRPWALQMSPNNLLYWEIIRRACEEGFGTLDFGRSLRDTGPLQFKLGWGARVRPQPCHIYSFRGGELRIDPKQRAVSCFVNQWKRLPRSVADALGPYVCRQVAGLI